MLYYFVFSSKSLHFFKVFIDFFLGIPGSLSFLDLSRKHLPAYTVRLRPCPDLVEQTALFGCETPASPYLYTVTGSRNPTSILCWQGFYELSAAIHFDELDGLDPAVNKFEPQLRWSPEEAQSRLSQNTFQIVSDIDGGLYECKTKSTCCLSSEVYVMD